MSRPLCLRERVVTSGRRWEKHGVLSTILLMWRLRLAYFFGADPAELARRYGYGRAMAEPVAIAILAKAPIAGLRQDPAHPGARRRRRGRACRRA